MKIISDSVSSVVIENNITLTKPEVIANKFSKYFANISSTIEFTVKFFKNKFHDFIT